MSMSASCYELSVTLRQAEVIDVRVHTGGGGLTTCVACACAQSIWHPCWLGNVLFTMSVTHMPYED